MSDGRGTTGAAGSSGSVKETIAVRAGEELNLARVADFLRERIPEMDAGELVVEQFAAGHSNLTYLLHAGEWEAVLRRPPLGPVAPKAHDMVRESRFLAALHPLFGLAPKPYLQVEDTELLGAPFFVMERRRGLVLDKKWPREFAQTPEVARQLSEAAVDTLVALHAVDYRATELEQMGHPVGYMERQVTGWIGRYERAKTDEVPEADVVAKFMLARMPQTTAETATIVHNDFKLNNMLFAAEDPSRATAVLDWEMATIGDPLSDLAIMVSYWAEADDPEVVRGGLSPLTMLPGFMTRQELIEAYARKSGRDVEAMDFYLTFAYYKIAVICQQIYFRWKQGQTKDPRFAAMGLVAQTLIQQAHAIAAKAGQ